MLSSRQVFGFLGEIWGFVECFTKEVREGFLCVSLIIIVMDFAKWANYGGNFVYWGGVGLGDFVLYVQSLGVCAFGAGEVFSEIWLGHGVLLGGLCGSDKVWGGSVAVCDSEGSGYTATDCDVSCAIEK